jgi:RNA polymerase sigma-70 factor (ECF subfamily)
LAADAELFERLVKQHEQHLYGYAYRLTGNHDDAQDLVGDALYEAFRHFDRFEPGTRFDRWLYRIMTNRNIDKMRRAAKIRIVSLDQPREDANGETQAWELPDDSPGPEEILLQQTLDEPIQKALDELPVEYRSAVILVDLEDLSYEEASVVLKCPVGTVRSRLHRGRALLREKLEGYLQGAPSL